MTTDVDTEVMETMLDDEKSNNNESQFISIDEDEEKGEEEKRNKDEQENRSEDEEEKRSEGEDEKRCEGEEEKRSEGEDEKRREGEDEKRREVEEEKRSEGEDETKSEGDEETKSEGEEDTNNNLESSEITRPPSEGCVLTIVRPEPNTEVCNAEEGVVRKGYQLIVLIILLSVTISGTGGVLTYLAYFSDKEEDSLITPTPMKPPVTASINDTSPSSTVTSNRPISPPTNTYPPDLQLIGPFVLAVGGLALLASVYYLCKAWREPSGKISPYSSNTTRHQYGARGGYSSDHLVPIPDPILTTYTHSTHSPIPARRETNDVISAPLSITQGNLYTTPLHPKYRPSYVPDFTLKPQDLPVLMSQTNY